MSSPICEHIPNLDVHMLGINFVVGHNNETLELGESTVRQYRCPDCGVTFAVTLIVHRPFVVEAAAPTVPDDARER